MLIVMKKKTHRHSLNIFLLTNGFFLNKNDSLEGRNFLREFKDNKT